MTAAGQGPLQQLLALASTAIAMATVQESLWLVVVVVETLAAVIVAIAVVDVAAMAAI